MGKKKERKGEDSLLRCEMFQSFAKEIPWKADVVLIIILPECNGGPAQREAPENGEKF